MAVKKQVDIVVNVKTNEADRRIGITANKMSGLVGIMGSVGTIGAVGIAAGTTAVIGLTAAVTAFSVSSIKTFADFESSMKRVQALSGATQSEYEQLAGKAREMGATTVFSASEAADAMQFLAMAGLNVNETMDTIPGVLNLASAGALDLATSADIATNIMTQFGFTASELDRVVDVLAKTVTSSNTDVLQLADAMNYIGPTAKSFGISLEETAATVGILANSGLKGSLATRALGTAITNLTRPTTAAEEAMADLGLEVFDTQGNFVGIIGLVQQLEKATKGMTQEQKQSALSTIFGAEAIQEMNILLDAGSTSLSEYANELENSTGAAQKMADIQTEGLVGASKEAKSAWEELQLSFAEGTGLTDLAEKGMDNLTETIRYATPLVTEAGRTFIDYFATPVKENWDEISEAAQNAWQGIQVALEYVGLGLQDGSEQFLLFSESFPEVAIQKLIEGLNFLGVFLTENRNEIMRFTAASIDAAETMIYLGGVAVDLSVRGGKAIKSFTDLSIGAFNMMVAGIMAPITLVKELLTLVGILEEKNLSGMTSGISSKLGDVPKFATGGDFITSGPQAIIVGDNPGGRERVKIEPMGAETSSTSNNNNVFNFYIQSGDPQSVAQEVMSILTNQNKLANLGVIPGG